MARRYRPTWHMRQGRRAVRRRSRAKCRSAKVRAVRRCRRAGKAATCGRAIRTAARICRRSMGRR